MSLKSSKRRISAIYSENIIKDNSTRNRFPVPHKLIEEISDKDYWKILKQAYEAKI